MPAHLHPGVAEIVHGGHERRHDAGMRLFLNGRPKVGAHLSEGLASAPPHLQDSRTHDLIHIEVWSKQATGNDAIWVRICCKCLASAPPHLQDSRAHDLIHIEVWSKQATGNDAIWVRICCTCFASAPPHLQAAGKNDRLDYE